MEAIVLVIPAASIAEAVVAIAIAVVPPQVFTIPIQLTFIVASLPPVFANVAVESAVIADVASQVFAVPRELALVVAKSLPVLADVAIAGPVVNVAPQVFSVPGQLMFVAANLTTILTNVAIESTVVAEIAAQVFPVARQPTFIVADFSSIFAGVAPTAVSVEGALIHPSGALGDFIGPHALEPMDSIGQSLTLDPLLRPAADHLTQTIGEWRDAAHAGAAQSLHDGSQITARSQTRGYRRNFLCRKGSGSSKGPSDRQEQYLFHRHFLFLRGTERGPWWTDTGRGKPFDYRMSKVRSQNGPCQGAGRGMGVESFAGRRSNFCCSCDKHCSFWFIPVTSFATAARLVPPKMRSPPPISLPGRGWHTSPGQ
jgi:hypothetical protein